MQTKQWSDGRVVSGTSRLVRPQQAHGRVVPRPILYLSVISGLLALVVATAGLIWRGLGETTTITTFLGQDVELYGGGLYRNDSLFVVGNNLGNDLVTAFVALPLLVVSLVLASRGSQRGRLLLLGTLGYFVYVGASYALGAVAYNELFLVYVAMFSASVFAFLVTFASIDIERLEVRATIPRRRIGSFMIASGVVTLAIWAMDPVTSLLSGEPPKSLETHTTLFTHAFDIGIIVPAAILAGWLILKRRSFGYVVASSLLILEALLLPMITVATIAQIRFGVDLAPEEFVGPIAGFGVFALLSVWVLAAILRNISPPAAEHAKGRTVR
jgi:hypothetical protein